MVPTKYTSEGIAESIKQFNISNKKVAIPRTSAANPTLKEKLTEMGALVKTPITSTGPDSAKPPSPLAANERQADIGQ